MAQINKAEMVLYDIYMQWSENWDVFKDWVGEDEAKRVEKAVVESKYYAFKNPNNVKKFTLPCSAHSRQCDICDDTGYIIYSCCGNDITDTIKESDLCPTCLEHCGEGDKVVCTCEELKTGKDE